MDKKQIALIGSTGTIGVELINLLSASEVDTISFYRDESKVRNLPFIKWVKVDLNNLEELSSNLQGVKSLFLLTGNNPGFSKAQIDVVKTAKKSGVNHIVKLSALGASPRSKSPLLLEHWEVEQAIEESDLSWTFLRPHMFMQNWITDIAGTIKEEGKIYSAVGDGKVPSIDTRDISAVAKEVLLNPEKHNGKKYVLTGGKAVGYDELAEALSQATNKQIVYNPLSMDEMRARMEKQGLSKKLIDSLLALSAYQKAGGATERVSDDVKNILNREPKTVYDFAEDYKKYFS